MYSLILAGIRKGSRDDEIVRDLQVEQPRLTVAPDDPKLRRRHFASDTKSAAFLREAIDGAPRCRICNARIHSKSISIDHKTRIQDGGLGAIENAQLTHPYCNTGYKESQHAQATRPA
ncbi:MAG TPA: HNH endonuclease signature motif containing protein [Thermoanaerobaculia bacterium]|nr:HNH endonuclease signature motif containing protein [Thermoanaerobaculia bacterium]